MSGGSSGSGIGGNLGLAKRFGFNTDQPSDRKPKTRRRNSRSPRESLLFNNIRSTRRSGSVPANAVDPTSSTLG